MGFIKHTKTSSLYLIFILFIGCKAIKSVNYQDELRSCINKEIREQINELGFSKLQEKKINIFDTIQKFEKTLVSFGLLNETTQQGYLNLISNLDENPILRQNFIQIKKINKFLVTANNRFILYPSLMYDFCPVNVILKTKSKELMRIKKNYDKIKKKGDPKPNLLKQLVLIPDFNNNKVLRLSVCNLIFLYIRNHYDKKFNHAIERFKDRKNH